MQRSYLRSITSHHADHIAQTLSEQQFLNPRQTLSNAINRVAAKVGFCDLASQQAVAFLELDCDTMIGRLRRTELLQLARTINRFWRQTVAAKANEPEPV